MTTPPIGISTGLFKKKYPDTEINKMLAHAKTLHIDALEILFARPSMLKSTFSHEEIEWIKSLQYFAIHSPFFTDAPGYEDIIYNDPAHPALKDIAHVIIGLNPSVCIIHPDLVKDERIWHDPEIPFAIENLKRKRNFSIEQIEALLLKHPHLKLVLDTEHAADWDEQTLQHLIDTFGDRIAHIQLSDGDRGYIDFLNNSNLSRFEPLRKLTCPIIIESKPSNFDQLPNIIERVRDFFS